MTGDGIYAVRTPRASVLNPATLLALLAALMFLLAAPRSAEAGVKFKVATTVTISGGETRVLVNLSTGRRVSAKFKPRSVSVRAAGMKISLKRQSSASATAGYRSSWRSKAFTGAQGASLQALGGKSVKVTIKARKSSSVRSSKVTLQTTGGGGGGGGATTPLFAAPGHDLIGNEAFTHLSPYFLNSAFTDCAAGPWPNCAVEERYVHCPTGSWIYQRTSGTGADINSPDSFTVTGANVAADGSWAVSYTTGTGANYIWQVSTAGIATGQYQFSSTSYGLGPMYWTQPAITWNYLSGAC